MESSCKRMEKKIVEDAFNIFEFDPLNKQQICGARMNKGGIKPSIELKK